MTSSSAETALVQHANAGPLIEREMGCTAVPPTWCVVVCEQGCTESWTVDVDDFEPRLTADDVERLLTPLLIAHEVEHGKW